MHFLEQYRLPGGHQDLLSRWRVLVRVLSGMWTMPQSQCPVDQVLQRVIWWLYKGEDLRSSRQQPGPVGAPHSDVQPHLDRLCKLKTCFPLAITRLSCALTWRECILQHLIHIHSTGELSVSRDFSRLEILLGGRTAASVWMKFGTELFPNEWC